MKTTPLQKPRAIVLPVTLCVILVLAIILAAYNTLVNNRNSAVVRSQQWNQAIPVVESGIEEALTQLHYAGTNSALLTSNSWTYGLDGLYHKARTNADGTYYAVSIQPLTNPIIISTGWVQVMGISGTINRRVKVVTTPQRPNGGGLNAKNGITTDKMTIDSFDSSTAPGGLYSAAVAQSNALILTDGTSAGIVSVGGTVDGSVNTGPGGTVSGGTVTGTISSDANVQFNDKSAPFTYGAGTTPSGGTYKGTNVTYMLVSGNYNMSSLSLSGQNEMAVTGNCVLYVNGGLSTAGQGEIYIAQGASLTVYVNGTISMTGNGIVNASEYANECTIFGMPGCTTVKLAGNGDFIGTVYAPDADITVTGNGNVIGALTGNSITFKGNGSFHYDQATLPAITNYAVASWNEF
jgi:hypothetical protein